VTDEEDLDEQDAPAGPADPSVWPGAEPKQAAYLTALINTAGIRNQACKLARVSRSSHYRWLDESETYRGLFARAMQQVVDALEDECTRRAVDGVTKGIYFQGDRVATERVYSDGLMMFLLRGAAPEKYRERTELKGEVTHNLKFAGTMEDLLSTYRKLTFDSCPTSPATREADSKGMEQR
jgi:hypothetical protein